GGERRRRAGLDVTPLLDAQEHQVAVVDRRLQRAAADRDAGDRPRQIDLDDAAAFVDGDPRLDFGDVDAQLRLVGDEEATQERPHRLLELLLRLGRRQTDALPTELVAVAGARQQRLAQHERAPAAAAD